MHDKDLQRFMDYHNSPGEGQTWYSICSAHDPDHPDENCNMCMAGRWCNDEALAADRALCYSNYRQWFRKHNGCEPSESTLKEIARMFPDINLGT